MNDEPAPLTTFLFILAIVVCFTLLIVFLVSDSDPAASNSTEAGEACVASLGEDSIDHCITLCKEITGTFAQSRCIIGAIKALDGDENEDS